jgi:hypothetical protein
MTATEAAKRSEKSQLLKVWQMDSTSFYVESEDGKIAYKCSITDQGDHCTCGDYATKSKSDPGFKCKHILAVLNSIPRNEVLEAQFLDKRKPKLDERFIKQVDGKDFVLYAGLLDLSHQKNLISLDVDILQYPSKDNDHTAVCKAIAKTATGGPFIDVGDANPTNCNAKVSKHLIRMASTRAKARCLRDLTNIGMTALEELGDISEVINDEDTNGKSSQARKDNVKKFPAKRTKGSQEDTAGAENQSGTVINETTAQDKTTSGPAQQTDGNGQGTTQTGDDNRTNLTGHEERVDTGKQPRTRQASKTGNGNGKGNGKGKPDQVPMMSEAQRNAVYNLSRRRNISVEELENLAMKTFNLPLESLTSSDASMFIRTLQQAS